MKLQQIKWINRILNNQDIPQYLYFVALILYVLIKTWDTTMFSRVMWFNNLGLVLAFFLVCTKVFFFDSLKVSEYIFGLVGALVGAISYFHGGSIHFLFLFIFAIGSRGIKLISIFKVYLIEVAIVFFMAFVAAQIGVIPDLVYDIYDWQKEWFFGYELPGAHSLGGIYTTDTAARIFFWFLVLFYLRGEKNGPLFSVLLIGVSLATYLITHGRLDSICILLTSVLAFFEWLFNKYAIDYWGKKWKRFWGVIGLIAMPIAAILSVLAALYITENIPLLSKMNTILSNRFCLGNEALREYGINLFGHELHMSGFGGITLEEFWNAGWTYNYVDVSYIQILLMNGAVVLIILVGMYMYIAWKNREDTYLMFCIALIALNCMVAQHLMDISYVPFILAFSATNKRIQDTTKKLKEYNLFKCICDTFFSFTLEH